MAVPQRPPEAGRGVLLVQDLEPTQCERVVLWRGHRAVGSLPGGNPMFLGEALIHENARGRGFLDKKFTGHALASGYGVEWIGSSTKDHRKALQKGQM